MKQLLSVGVIGTGNCGGQFADAAKGIGFDAIAINASQDDIDTLANKLDCFLIGDGNGTGKSREEAQQFLSNHTALYKDGRLISFVTSHDVCVVATSIGGGFGSGTSLELIKTLSETYPDKLFIPAGVMPFNAEGFTAQDHSIQWLQDLEDMSIPYILYDNDKFSGEKEQDVCNKVCNDFLTDLCIMRGDYIFSTTTGGIDPRDMLTVYSVPGRIVSAGLKNIDDDDLVDKSIMKTVKDYIDNKSAHAVLTDDKQIMASATMYCLSEEFDPYKGTIRSDVQELYGDHISDYTNFSDCTDDDANNSMGSCVAIVLSGLSAPQTRIGRLVKRRNKLFDSATSRKAPESKLHSDNILPASGVLKLKAKSFGSSAKTTVDSEQMLIRYNNEGTTADTDN